MILTCPSCGTRYVVKDGAIPPDGRTVRCAQCKHSWHQDPEAGAEASPVDEGAVSSAPSGPQEEAANFAPGSVVDPEDAAPSEGWQPSQDGHPAEAEQGAEEPMAAEPSPAVGAEHGSYDDSVSGPEAQAAIDPYPEEAVPYEEPAAPPEPEAQSERTSHPLRASRMEADDLYSPFADRDEDMEEPRRRWPMIVLVVLLVVALVAAGTWFLAPTSFKSRLGLAQSDGAPPLLLQVQSPSRQELASGNSLLEVSGVVINPTDETLVVPPINAQLRSLEQKVVYKWVIPPPAPRLAPGGSASFNSANLDVPADAFCLEVVLSGDRRKPPVCRESDAVGA